MANVFFKRGSLANLSQQPKVDGTIYVTTDERAIYVDVDSNTRIRIGDFREFTNWAAIEALTGANKDPQALYYANQENILAKWDSTRSRWVQVNGQSAVDDIIAYVHQAASNSNNDVILQTQIADNNSSTIVGQTTYISGDSSLLKLTGASTINNTQGNVNYGRTEATITLTPANIVDTSTIAASNISYGGGVVGVALTLSNNRTGTDASGTTVNTTTATTPINLISGGGLTIERNSTTGDIEFSAGGGIEEANTSFDASGVLNLELLDYNNNEPVYTTSAQPIIRYGSTATSDAVFASGIAVLNVYTTTQVDDLISGALKAVNAMTFKGTLGSAGTVAALPTTNVEIGDTYKVITPSNYNNQICRVGDMFIASGTEDSSTGKITGTVTWNYIPSGNDDGGASYELVYDSTSGDIRFNDDSGILTNITIGTKLVASGSTGSITLAHETVTRTDTTATAVTQTGGSNLQFNAITGITSDSTGHITGVTTTPITVVDTHNEISSVSYSKSAATASGTTTVTNQLVITDELGGHSASHTVTSSSLGLSVSGTETTIDIVWGSF